LLQNSDDLAYAQQWNRQEFEKSQYEESGRYSQEQIDRELALKLSNQLNMSNNAQPSPAVSQPSQPINYGAASPAIYTQNPPNLAHSLPPPVQNNPNIVYGAPVNPPPAIANLAPPATNYSSPPIYNQAPPATNYHQQQAPVYGQATSSYTTATVGQGQPIGSNYPAANTYQSPPQQQSFGQYQATSSPAPSYNSYPATTTGPHIASSNPNYYQAPAQPQQSQMYHQQPPQQQVQVQGQPQQPPQAQTLTPAQMDAALAALMEMGFDRQAATSALSASGWNTDAALNILLNESPAPAANATQPPPKPPRNNSSGIFGWGRK
jgi:hypothetical protein